MSLNLLGCKIPQPDQPTALSDVGIDPNKQTDVQRRMNILAHLLDATAAGNTVKRQLEENAIRKVLLDNMERSTQVVEVQALNPERAQGFARFLANDLGVSKKFLGMGDAYTEGGWVRESMARMRRAYQGGIERNLREMAVVEKARDLYQPLRQELKQLGVNQADIEYILSTAHEQGWYPHIMQSATPGRQGQLLLTGRINNFRAQLASQYGLPDAMVARVIDSGRQIADLENNVAQLAFDAGLSLNRQRFLQTMPLYLSDEAKMRFNWKFQDAGNGIVHFDNGEVDSINNILAKSRMVSDFVVEDEVLFDYVLRHVSAQKYGSPGALYEKATGTVGAGIADVLDNHHALTRAFLDVAPDTLDAFVDSGLLSKLPLPSTDIVRELSRVYDFPFEGLSEVFAVDWEKGMEIYGKNLERLAQKSGYVNQLVKNAIDGNWGVPRSIIDGDTTGRYAGFVPLVSYDKSQAGVIPAQLLSQMGLDARRQREMGLMLENTYVHPTVAALAKSNLALQISPEGMGTYARFVHTIQSKFRTLAVATFEYVQRQGWNTLVAQHAGEGNILLVPKYATTMLLSELSGRPIAGFLDDTRKIYKLRNGTMLSELGLWNHLSDQGFLSKFEPLTGQLLNPGGYHNWNPLAVKRNLRWMSNTVHQHNGWLRLAEELGNGASAALDQVTYPIKWANNWLDNAGRFAMMVSLASPRGLGDIPRAILSQAIKKFEYVEDAMAHTGNFYFQYDDITQADKFLSDNVIPFWGFHAKNVPAAVRFVVRHPTRFMAYQRLYALANHSVANDSEQNQMLTEGTVPDWLLQQTSIYFKTSRGYFAVPMNSLDPISSGLQWVTNPAEATLEHFGIFPNARTQATDERVKENPTQTENAVLQMFDNTYPVYKAIAQTVANQDSFGRPLDEGAKVTTFLGYRMSPVTRLWLESLAPTLSTLNRANPGNVMGTPMQRDPQTGSWQPGTPSQMPFSGGAPRSDRDNFQTNNPYAWLSSTGVKVYPVDVYLNAGYTYDELRRTVQDTKRFRQSLEQGLLQLQEGTDVYQQQQAKISEVDQLLTATVDDMNRLEDWAKAHNFNVRQAVDRLTESNRRIGDLPPTPNREPVQPVTEPTQVVK